MSEPRGYRVRNLGAPDEFIDLGTVQSAIVVQGGLTVAHNTHQPGWRWSTHVQPVVGTEWCETYHVGIVFSGRAGYRLATGETFELGPLDLMEIPPGHDAWVLGDVPFVTIDWTGARGWLAPLEAMTERVLATVLFTDIVDSTGLALRLGDRAWTDRLASHEARTRETLRRFRGREIKMTGDGVLATFDGAARAVRCADTLRRDARDLGLTLRSSVHTGEIEIDGDEVRGVTVHEASRMLALAEPDTIVISETTRTFTSDLRLDLDDRGVFELRGIPGPRHLYQLRALNDGGAT